MKQNKGTVTTNVLLVVVILLIIGLFFYFKSPLNQPSINTSSQTDQVKTPSDQIVSPNSDQNSLNSAFTGKDPDGKEIKGDGPIPKTIAQAQIFRISIKNFSFNSLSSGKPVVGKLPLSEEIIWTNNDSMPHTVTFDDGSLDSGSIGPGETFRFFFTKSGTYSYHCSFHPNMKGVLNFE